MLGPEFFRNKDNNDEIRKEKILSTIISLVSQKVKKIFDETILKVKVEGTKTDDILYKINGQLYSIVNYLKSFNTISPSQKIAIKTTDLVTLNKEIEKILREIASKEVKVMIPPVQRVNGEIRVNNFPPQYNFDRILNGLIGLQQTIKSLRLEIPPQQTIKFPDIKIPEFPKEMQVPQMAKVIDAISQLRDEIKSLPKVTPKLEIPDVMKVSVDNFPPTKYPMPVTNININPLRGFVKSTVVTVTTGLTVLPPEVLSNRRAVMVFNNDASNTIYIGGSEMSASNGLPVLAQTYSPVIDAGSKMILYGMTTSSTAEARVLEISNENIGG